MSASVFTLARQKYLTEAVPVEFRARALSILGGVNRIGIFIGPFIGAAVMQFVGITGAYWVGMAGMMAAAVIAVSIPNLAVADGTSDPAEPSPTLRGVALSHAGVFLSAGAGILLLSAPRASRRVVIPLWRTTWGWTHRRPRCCTGCPGRSTCWCSTLPARSWTAAGAWGWRCRPP